MGVNVVESCWLLLCMFKLSIIYFKGIRLYLEIFKFWQFHDVFACEVVDLSCLILQQEILTYDLNNSEVELWNIFSFAKAKWYNKVLSFGSKYS